MNRDRITGSYSRHLASRKFDKSFSVGEVGSVGLQESVQLQPASTPHNVKLISLLDEEQLQQVPSTEEIWSRRKSLLAGLDDDEGICPCLARIFREQLEEMKRILPARGSVDLTRVSKIDAEQTAEPRRNSLPSRYVSLLDQEQRPSHANYEVVLKAYMKMKRTKCRCDHNAKSPGEEREIPEVNIIPSTPAVGLGCEAVEEILPQVAADTPGQTQARNRAGGHQQRKRPS